MNVPVQFNSLIHKYHMLCPMTFKHVVLDSGKPITCKRCLHFSGFDDNVNISFFSNESFVFVILTCFVKLFVAEYVGRDIPPLF